MVHYGINSSLFNKAMLTGWRRSGLDESGFTLPFSAMGLNSRILYLICFSLVFLMYCLLKTRKTKEQGNILYTNTSFTYILYLMSPIMIYNTMVCYDIPCQLNSISQGHYIEEYTGLCVAIHAVDCCHGSTKTLFCCTDHYGNVRLRLGFIAHSLVWGFSVPELCSMNNFKQQALTSCVIIWALYVPECFSDWCALNILLYSRAKAIRMSNMDSTRLTGTHREHTYSSGKN